MSLAGWMLIPLACAGAPAMPALAQKGGSAGPEAIIIQPPPSSQLKVGITTDRPSYRPGDSIVITIELNRPAYVYIVDMDTEGQVRLLLPNRYERSNHLPAGTTRLPGGGYTLRIAGRPGVEYLQAIASLAPVDSLDPFGATSGGMSGPQLFSQETFPEAKEPTGIRQRIIQRIEAVVPSGQWSVAWTSFRVEGPEAPPPPPSFNEAPVARFEVVPDTPVAGSPVTLDARGSYDRDGFITRYAWDIDGDRRPDAYGERISWTFDEPGRYLVTLTVTDNRRTSDSASQWVVVRAASWVELSIDSRPDDAAVYVDGRFLGRTPVRKLVEQGDHSIEIVQPGYKTWRTRINLDDVEALRLEVDLER